MEKQVTKRAAEKKPNIPFTTEIDYSFHSDNSRMRKYDLRLFFKAWKEKAFIE